MDLKKEYSRVRKNLQAQIRGLKKRGYNVPENYIPKIPKKITEASVRRLQKAQAEIPQKITYGTPPVSYGRGRDIERSAAAVKGQETKRKRAKTKQEKVIISAFREYKNEDYDAWSRDEIREAISINGGDIVKHFKSDAEHSTTVPNWKNYDYAAMIHERAEAAAEEIARLNEIAEYPNKPTINVNMRKSLKTLLEYMDAYLYGYMVKGYGWNNSEDLLDKIRALLQMKLTAEDKKELAESEEDIVDVMYDDM